MRMNTPAIVLGLASMLVAATPALAQSLGEPPPAPPPPPAVSEPAPQGNAAPPTPPPPPAVSEPAPQGNAPPAPPPPPAVSEEVPQESGPPAAAPSPKPFSLLDRFAGSSIDWGHVASSELLGVSSSYQGVEDFSYRMSWDVTPSFFAYRSDRHAVRLQANLGVSVELTNSNTTTTQHEAELADLPLTVSDTITLASWGGENVAPPGPAAAFNPTLAGGGEYGTWVVPEAAVVFPLSRYSQTTRVLATRLGAGLRQRIKLLGGAAPGLQNLTLSLGGTWRHDFNRTTVPTSPDVNIPRQSTGGTPLSSDVIGKYFLATDRLSASFGLVLPIYGGLELWGTFSYRVDFKPKPPSDACISLLTGCAPSSVTADARTTFGYTNVYLGLAYRFLPELTAEVGYETFTSTTNAAFKASNPLYSPGDSFFYADVAFFPEQLLQRFVRPAAPAGSASPAARE